MSPNPLSSATNPNHSLPVIDALYRISSLAGKMEDPQEALGLILDEIVRFLRATSGSISLINPDNGKLEIEVAQDLPDDTNEVNLKPGQGITGWVALHGKPLLVADVREDVRYVELKSTVRSEMAVPMTERGNVIGVVNVDSDVIGAFDENDLKVLTLMTSEAAKVTRNLWLIQKLRTKANQLEAVISIGQGLVTKMEIQEILDRITEEARQIVGCRLCSISLLDESGEKLHLHSISGASEKFRQQPPLSIQESAVGVAIQRGKQIEVLDISRTEDNPAVLQSIFEEGLVSFLATPISYEDNVIGVLNAYTGRKHRFNNEEKRLFTTLASLAAVGIQNVRLYQRVFKSEEKLRQAEKLNALGLLASEIAHEIRNPLTVLKLLFDSLDLEFGADDPRQKDAQVIGEKLDELESIVGRILAFSRSSDHLHEKLDFRTIIEDTLLLIRMKLSQSQIQLKYEPSSELLLVEGNKGQLQQVLLNLFLNALDAMPQGGQIHLEATIDPMNGNGPILIVRVKDNGSGIDTDMIPHIFETFLTDKKDGTGLGLAIAQRIMAGHHGALAVENTGSEGTTMRLQMPAYQESPSSGD
ncbi:MAG: GAF domain-containing protein [Opitutales bacterium]|nr:GAF domain-containing protein [Opitutales bacterium]